MDGLELNACPIIEAQPPTAQEPAGNKMVTTAKLSACESANASSGARLPKSGIKDRPEVDDPPEKHDPEDRGQNELNDRHPEATLHQLAKTRDKEAADGGDDVASGALTCHGSKVPRLRARRNSHHPQQCGRRVFPHHSRSSGGL